jgi:hypothetical protein
MSLFGLISDSVERVLLFKRNDVGLGGIGGFFILRIIFNSSSGSSNAVRNIN